MKRLIGAAAVVGIAAFGGAGAFDDDTTRDASGDIVEAGGLGVFAMQIGDCIQVPDGELVESVEAVPCSLPHGAQVFAEPTSTYSGIYDESLVWQSGLETCTGYFDSFVGTSYSESELYIDLFYPSVEGWKADDRGIVCLIVPAPDAAPLIGDAGGSER